MTAIILNEAEDDLERAFDYYEQRRPALGSEMIDEFRRSLDLTLKHPNAWQPLDETYRRCRRHRFPYGIVYRLDAIANQVVVVTVMHLSERPEAWRTREHR